MKLSEITELYERSFRQSKLPFLYCSSCNHNFYYPRDRCPRCHSNNLQVKLSSGKGKIFSYTVIHRKGKAEVFYAIVELEEGFRMYSNISDRVEIEDKVEVFFSQINGAIAPYFRKSASSHTS
ncbi:MAG: OB-fold domain-containing protein [Conexivisphaerales archaeon]